jgi:uncharacterized protein (TIRG00374 family)
LKSKLLSFAKYILLLGIGILLLWLTFRNEDVTSIFSKIKHADLRWVAISLFFALLAFWSRAYRWKMLIEPLGYHPRLSVTLYSLLVGYFANLAIPRIGEITRCGSLGKSEKIPFNVLFGTVIIERVIDLIMLGFSILVVAAVEFDIMKGFLKEKLFDPLGEKIQSMQYAWLLFISMGAIAILTFILIRKNLASLRSRTWFLKLETLLSGVVNGVRTVVKMKKNGLFIFHTFFIWIMYFFMTWTCFFALDSTSHLSVKAGMFVLVIGGLGMSAPVQGGIGAYHWIVSQGLLLYQVPLTDGIVFATLVHTYQTLLVIVLGLLSLLMLFIRRKNNHE